jgi:ABC-type Fe3+ transport system permease subunit
VSRATLRSQIRGALTLLSACATLAFALLGAAAPAAMSAEGLGSGGAFNRLTEPAQETTTSTTPTTSSVETNRSNSTTVVVLALVAAIALLIAIAFVIVRDARRVAPVTDGNSGGSVRDPAARLRKRRAQAKAARRQRKRNR